ncbi:MAG: hypothetical protein WC556_08500 [Candidatus Methanoperedens sp.]
MLEKNIKTLQVFVVLVISYMLLFQNRLWADFPDEGDNFAGGWLISKGYVLYKDTFSHHMPFPYYYASLLIKLGLNDVSGLRIGMSLTILFFWILILVIFKDKINYKLLCIMIFLSAIAHPIFWGHMFLADSFFAYSFLIIFLYFFSNPQLNFNIKDKIIIASMIYISIMSALVSIIPIMFLGVYYTINKLSQFYVEKTNIKNKVSGELIFVLLIFTPFILSLVYFYCAGSLQDLFNQAYLFNKIYYSQFTGMLTNPQFFSIIKAYSEFILNFFISDYGWLINEKSFVCTWGCTPLFFEGFLVISNLITSVIFWVKRKRSFAIFYFFCLGLLLMQRVWVHAIPYYLLSFFSISLIITEAYELFSYRLRNQQLITKINLWLIPIIIYAFLAIMFLGVISYAYVSNGSGIGPNIAYVSDYDIIIQTLTLPNDTIWVAPLQPSLYFTNDRFPASRYTFYLPWQSISEEINKEILEDLNIKKPPLIIFSRDVEIGEYVLKDYGKVIDDYVIQNYQQVDPDDPTYKNIYLIKTKQNQLFRTLIDSGLYQPVDAKQLDKSVHISEIVAGEQVVQTFTPKHRINRIDLMLATFVRSNHGKIIFHIKDNLNKEIYTKTEEISKINDSSWYSIRFQPLNDTLIGKTIYLVIEAPESKPGDAVTIYSSKNDTYKMGGLYINGQPTGKDLTFKTYWNPYSNNATDSGN